MDFPTTAFKHKGSLQTVLMTGRTRTGRTARLALIRESREIIAQVGKLQARCSAYALESGGGSLSVKSRRRK